MDHIVNRSQGNLSIADRDIRIAIVFVPHFPHTPEAKLYHRLADLADIDSRSDLFEQITHAMQKFNVPVLVQPVPHITEFVTGIVEQGSLHVLYGDTLTGSTTAAIVLDFVTQELNALVAAHTSTKGDK